MSAYNFFKAGNRVLQGALETLALRTSQIDRAGTVITAETLTDLLRRDAALTRDLGTSYSEFLSKAVGSGIRRTDAQEEFVSDLVRTIPERARNDGEKLTALRQSLSHYLDEAAARAQPSAVLGGVARQGDNRLAFAATLQMKKWNTKIEPDTFARFEAALQRDNKLYSGTNVMQDLGRSPYKKIDDIVKAVREDKIITLEELTLLKEKGGKLGSGFTTNTVETGRTNLDKLADAAASLLNPKKWLSAIGTVPKFLANPLSAVESYRWNGLTPSQGSTGLTAIKGASSTMARLAGTTALAYGTLIYIPGQISEAWNYDYSNLSVSQDKGWGLVVQALDDRNILGSTGLETHTGNKDTHWVSDLEYDRLTKGKAFNDAFLERIKYVTHEDLSKLATSDKSSVEAWRTFYNVAVKLSQNQSAKNGQIMPAINAAFSRNIGMTGTKENATTVDPTAIVAFTKERYIAITAAKLAGSKPEDEAFRNAFFSKYYGPNFDLANNIQIVEGLRNIPKTRGAFALDREVVARYLVEYSKSVGKDQEAKLLDNQGTEDIANALKKADLEKRGQLARDVAPVSIFSGAAQSAGPAAQPQSTPAPQDTPPSPVAKQLSGNVFKARLDSLKSEGTLTDELYRKLADAFKASTKAPVADSEEFTAKNVAKSNEIKAFMRAAEGIFSEKSAYPQAAVKMTIHELVAPGPL